MYQKCIPDTEHGTKAHAQVCSKLDTALVLGSGTRAEEWNRRGVSLGSIPGPGTEAVYTTLCQSEAAFFFKKENSLGAIWDWGMYFVPKYTHKGWPSVPCWQLMEYQHFY